MFFSFSKETTFRSNCEKHDIQRCVSHSLFFVRLCVVLFKFSEIKSKQYPEKINVFLRLFSLFHTKHLFALTPLHHMNVYGGRYSLFIIIIISFEFENVCMEKGTTVGLEFKMVYLFSSESTWNFDVEKQSQRLKVKSHDIGLHFWLLN